MSEELKPCPFCGGPAELEEVEMGSVSNWTVGCTERDGERLCMGYQSLTSFARKGEAIAAWNRRAAPNPPAVGVGGLVEALREAEAWMREAIELARTARQ